MKANPNAFLGKSTIKSIEMEEFYGDDVKLKISDIRITNTEGVDVTDDFYIDDNNIITKKPAN